MKIDLLKIMMVKSGISQKELAKKLGISRFWLKLKFGGVVEFRLEEILRISQLCSLNEKQINNIFFDK